MYKRRFHILLICVFCCIGTAQAQWRLGVEGGVSLNWHVTDYGYATGLSNTLGAGGTIMLSTQYNFYKWLGLRADFGWVQRNYIENMSNNRRVGFARNYLLFPLTVSFSFGSEKVRGYGDVGGFVGGWVGSELDDRRDGRFDAGAVARLGVMFAASEKVYVNIEAVTYAGFINSHYTGTQYFTQRAIDETLTLQIGVGYKF